MAKNGARAILSWMSGCYHCQSPLASLLATTASPAVSGCTINNIKIPEELSLLGVDNDEMICHLSDPPISSIVTDVEKGGYEAGRLIDRMINGEIKDPFNIIIEPSRFELRKSTEKYDISNEYISQVVNFIETILQQKLTLRADRRCLYLVELRS